MLGELFRRDVIAVRARWGREAMDDTGVLAGFNGRLVHGFWKSYLGYLCERGFCNAYLLRELTFLAEELDQARAADMVELLVQMPGFRRGLPAGAAPTDAELSGWLARYRGVIAAGNAANPGATPENSTARRGEKRRSKAQNPLVRMGAHERQIPAFLYDPSVPFTNNVAGRDARMMKVQQKVSGCFRSSYLPAMRKRGRDLLDALVKEVLGEPFATHAAPSGQT